MGEKILVAMSGGVDSSVAALRLQQQGYEIELSSHKEQHHREKKQQAAPVPGQIC